MKITIDNAIRKLQFVRNALNDDIDFPLVMYNIGGVLDGNDD